MSIGAETARDERERIPAASVGRIVHYVLPDGHNAGDHRPAIIVRVWSPECVQLQVFTDGTNDGAGYGAGIDWRSSVARDDSALKRGSWHWPERS